MYRDLVMVVDGSEKSSTKELLLTVSCISACKVPSRAAPRRILCSVIGRDPTGPNIWVRSRASLTGTPVSLAAIAVSITCVQALPLLPKPPPRKGHRTRTLDGSMPKVRAAVFCTPEMFWLES